VFAVRLCTKPGKHSNSSVEWYGCDGACVAVPEAFTPAFSGAAIPVPSHTTAGQHAPPSAKSAASHAALGQTADGDSSKS
jgi:hypothetical protein